MSVRYLIAWFGMMGLAIANGAVRDVVYRARMGDRAAHQISTVILLLLFSGYFWGFSRFGRWHRSVKPGRSGRCGG